jgi:hypothetical protein
VSSRAGVPENAGAVIINVMAVAAEARGLIAVHPCLDDRPLASSLNYVPGANGGNEIIATLNLEGELCLYTRQATHLNVDVVGHVLEGCPAAQMSPNSGRIAVEFCVTLRG